MEFIHSTASIFVILVGHLSLSAVRPTKRKYHLASFIDKFKRKWILVFMRMAALLPCQFVKPVYPEVVTPLFLRLKAVVFFSQAHFPMTYIIILITELKFNQVLESVKSPPIIVIGCNTANFIFCIDISGANSRGHHGHQAEHLQLSHHPLQFLSLSKPASLYAGSEIKFQLLYLYQFCNRITRQHCI